MFPWKLTKDSKFAFLNEKSNYDIGTNLTYIYTCSLFCICMLLHLFLNVVINEFSFFSLRFCSSESSGWGGCDAMCCGRGYRSFTKKIVERCECKYYWCCYVKCKTCEKTLHLNVCRQFILIELLKKPFSGLSESCISLCIETLHF